MKRANPAGEFWVGDYKGDDAFSFLRNCSRYRGYKSTLDALDAVCNLMIARMSGENTTRYPVTPLGDEYIAGILALIGEDKKPATVVMNKVSEILLWDRSINAVSII